MAETDRADADRVRDAWDARADAMEASVPHVGSYPVSGLVRRVRRLLDLSQRELARAAKVSPSTVGRVESGAMAPTLDLFSRLLAIAGFHLVVVDRDGRIIEAMRDSEDTKDGAERRYPSHLDTILDPRPGEWWADLYGLARPPETFLRDRKRRDEMRARSQWEVRVKKLRHAPEPPRPGEREARAAQTERMRTRSHELPQIGADDVDVDEWWDDPRGESPPGRRRPS